MVGNIFKIQRFCYGDGPGIRTTIFLKGCPLRCLWCHNPESQSMNAELGYSQKRCTRCRKCEKVCGGRCHVFTDMEHKLQREKCILCGACVQACPAEALTLWGWQSDTDDIMKVVMADKSYFRDGGGITISGGEPLAQPEFTLELLKEAKRAGLHTCLDTSGYGRTEILLSMIPYVDLFLYDIKHYDNSEHIKYTSVENGLILRNLQKLSAHRAKIWIRCPVIPGINDKEEHLRYVGELADKLDGVKAIGLLPYHNWWTDKAVELGRNIPVDMRRMTRGELDEWKQYISKFTRKTVMTG